MKSFLISLGTITLLATTTGPLLTTNFQQANNLVNRENVNNQMRHHLLINLKNHNKDFVRAIYQPNSPKRAAFHYIDITGVIGKKSLTKSHIIKKNQFWSSPKWNSHKRFCIFSNWYYYFWISNFRWP